MGERHKARQAALTILYQCDIRNEWDADRMSVEYFASHEGLGPEGAKFGASLAAGVTENMEQIDGRISAALKNWSLDRLGYLERNILRLGAYEILFQNATPPKVVMDEAVKLAVDFCDKNSSALVNGALQRIMDEKLGGSGGSRSSDGKLAG